MARAQFVGQVPLSPLAVWVVAVAERKPKPQTVRRPSRKMMQQIHTTTVKTALKIRVPSTPLGTEAEPNAQNKPQTDYNNAVNRLCALVSSICRAVVSSGSPEVAISQERSQRALHIGIHRNAPSRIVLGDGVAHCDRVGDLAAGIKDHRPIEIGDLACPQSGFDRQQDYCSVAGGKGSPSLLGLLFGFTLAEGDTDASLSHLTGSMRRGG